MLKQLLTRGPVDAGVRADLTKGMLSGRVLAALEASLTEVAPRPLRGNANRPLAARVDDVLRAKGNPNRAKINTELVNALMGTGKLTAETENWLDQTLGQGWRESFARERKK